MTNTFDCTLPFRNGKRILIVAGHYGSGKTEFAVNYVLQLRKQCPDQKIAIVDLDLINPYFRSREKRSMLEKEGIDVYGGSTHDELLADIQSYSAAILTPLQDENCYTVIDAGGNFSGARPLKQFMKYLRSDITELAVVVNAYRYETRCIDDSIHQIEAIEAETGLTVNSLINNTHLLRETEKEHILHGYEVAKDVEKTSGLPLLVTTYPRGYVDESELDIDCALMPVDLIMRATWLDK